ncbi:hypothetical protein F443_19887 [Phytophthora nicotianae P1569]|uniref:Crinkler effector protein N-terminal domain-containing protein n=1 Tax=Phytophthora nicotianae P1569 TaxID=1317065 RepID=V9E2V8_PHYNI|nr:hypothetical protein F443_19887 [Phytophthora nicotianae P1569]
MVKLFCAIVGVAGSAFEVDIDAVQLVGDLKKMIAEDQKFDFAANKLQLYLAKKNGAWLSSKDPDVISMRSGVIPEQVKTLMNVEVDPADDIGDVFEGAPTKKTVHVLVVVPLSTAEDVALSAKDLCTVDPDVQLNLWKSVVRVSSEHVCSGTALVVDQTPIHLYLMTNLHLWTDATFSKYLIADFKREIRRYKRLQ